jgi:hypothetical protein
MSDDTEPSLHLQTWYERPALCGEAVSQTWRTTVYAWAECARCVAVADRMMAEDERLALQLRLRRTRRGLRTHCRT